MRGGVDAARQAAHDDDAGRRQVAADRRGNGQPLARRGARTRPRRRLAARAARSAARAATAPAADRGSCSGRPGSRRRQASPRAGRRPRRRGPTARPRWRNRSASGRGVRGVAGAAAGPDEERLRRARAAADRRTREWDGASSDGRARRGVGGRGWPSRASASGVEVGHAASGARRAADAARAPDPVAVTSAISIIRPVPPAPQVAHGRSPAALPAAGAGAIVASRPYDSATGRAHPAVGAPCSARLRRCAGRRQVNRWSSASPWPSAGCGVRRSTGGSAPPRSIPLTPHAFNNLAHRLRAAGRAGQGS